MMEERIVKNCMMRVFVAQWKKIKERKNRKLCNESTGLKENRKRRPEQQHREQRSYIPFHPIMPLRATDIDIGRGGSLLLRGVRYSRTSVHM
jgi:hypothetical protein